MDDITGFILFVITVGGIFLAIAAVLMPIFVIICARRIKDLRADLKRIEYLAAIIANK